MTLGLAIGLVVGLFVGYQIGSSGPSSPAASAMPGMPPLPPQMPSAPPPGGGADALARIATLQSIVARDPKNVQAWVRLGNDFFDTHQPQKAVEAYGRALELQPNDPNVLTDQGVMYRELRQYDKAIQNFEKASKADPTHVQSLFNMGVVYSTDLKLPQKAIEAWSKVVRVAPESPQAAQARQALADHGAKAP